MQNCADTAPGIFAVNRFDMAVQKADVHAAVAAGHGVVAVGRARRLDRRVIAGAVGEKIEDRIVPHAGNQLDQRKLEFICVHLIFICGNN